ncbi:MAG: GDP-L-fucose synthase [Desulfofustis sp.]
MKKEDLIYVAGHRGMVGSAVLRLLEQEGYQNLLTRTSGELDLTDQAAVHDFFSSNTIDYVVLAAAKVGGIHANSSYPAEFIYQNLMIQANVIHQAYLSGVSRLLFLGSSCIYPKFCSQPMKEEYLLSGVLESTNEPYAVAKIGGIKMCESYNRQFGTSYRAVMPTNLYGPEDNYHLENSHVIPAIIRKCHLAKLAARRDAQGIERDRTVFGPIPADSARGLYLNDTTTFRGDPYVQLWGSGGGRREFLHVDDMAAACLRVMSIDQQTYDRSLDIVEQSSSYSRPSFLNVGTGKDCTIAEAAGIIQQVVGFHGDIRFDRSQPDGTPQKLLDVGRIEALGWRPSFSLKSGLQDAYEHYCRQLSEPL